MRDLKDIEQLMKNQSQKQSFNFEGSFWDDMDSMLDANSVGSTNLSSEESVHAAESTLASAVNGQSFEYKESYWSEMSAALDRAERRKKFILWSKLAGAAAVLGVISLSAYVYIQDGTELTDEVHLNNQNSSFEIQELPTKRVVVGIENKSNALNDNSLAFTNADQRDVLDKKKYVQSTKSHKSIDLSNKSHIPFDEMDKESLISHDKQKDLVINEANKKDAFELMLSKELIPVLSIDAFNPSLELSLLPKLNESRYLSSSIFSVHAGALLANAPQGKIEGNNRVGYGFKGGLSYHFSKNKWGLETGLNFIYRNGLNQRLNQNSNRYGMSLFRETNQTIYKSMMSLEIPLMATVQLKRHRIGLGFSGVYNMAVNSTLERSNNISDEKEIVRNNFANTEGMNKFDARIQLNYEFKINQHFDVGLTAQYGLLNQVNTDVIPASEGYNELNASIYLKYNILKF